jgi:hypothetical protein
MVLGGRDDGFAAGLDDLRSRGCARPGSRYPLTFGPTPIEKLQRLSGHLGGAVDIFAKRDDCNRPPLPSFRVSSVPVGFLVSVEGLGTSLTLEP